MTLFFDTETTGRDKHTARMVQLAYVLYDGDQLIEESSHIVRPNGFTIPEGASLIHGITTDQAMREGVELTRVLNDFCKAAMKADLLVGHNVDYDLHIVAHEMRRMSYPVEYRAHFGKLPTFCTMRASTEFCAIPSPYRAGDYKWPRLSELHEILFEEEFEDAHDALADIRATVKCYFALIKKGVIKNHLV